MVYMNDCSIRIVRSFIKNFVQEIFVQVSAYKKANYGIVIRIIIVSA